MRYSRSFLAAPLELSNPASPMFSSPNPLVTPFPSAPVSPTHTMAITWPGSIGRPASPSVVPSTYAPSKASTSPGRRTPEAESLVPTSSPHPTAQSLPVSKLGLHARDFRSHSTPPLRISGLYNFPDWNIAFEVGDTVYRVHKFFFKRESAIFAKWFDHNPAGQHIPLPNVTCAEFDALLEFMYSAIFESDPINLEKWISILHLSNMWAMTRVKKKALKYLSVMEELTPVEKIVMAAKEEVESWFLPAFISLVERNAPLSVEEARRLISLGERRVGPVAGLDIVPLLAQARERFRNLRQWEGLTSEVVVGEVLGHWSHEPIESCTPKF